MTAVAKDLSNPVRFGDHKTLHEDDRKPAKQELRRQSGHFKPTPQTGPPMTLGGKKKPSLEVPDYVALDGNAHVRFVGELKTPWTQNLMSLNGKEVTWRRHIGQIANYMKVFKVKYGFWTTYEQTVFLKQEQNNSGRWVLKVSNVIKYDTASDLSVGRAGNLRGNVSLRECMLYLMHEAKLDYKANNNDVGFVEFVEPYSSTSTSQPQSQPKKDLSQGSIGIEDDNKQEGGGHHGRRRRVAAGTGKSLQPVEEASRDSSLRQQLATSGLQDLPRLVTRASSEGSSVPSTSSKHSAQRRPPEGEPRRSSTDVQRGRQSTRDSSQPRAGEAARARSTGKVMLSEKARGKQRETTASSSRERRARADASSGDRQEPPREPFRSSQGQTRRPHQWLEGDAKLYETPTDLHPPSQGGIFTSGPEATTQLPTRLAPALAPFKHIRHPLQREKQGPLLVSGRGIHLKKNKNPIRR